MQMLYKYRNGKPVPELLVSENFNEFDIAKFFVINGCWDGRYVSGAVFVDCTYKGKRFVGSYEIYKFKETPPKDCLDGGNKMYSEYEKSYNAWFWLFRDLVEKGGDCMSNIKDYFNKENSHKVFCCIVDGEEIYLQCYYDKDSDTVEAYSWKDYEDSKNYIEVITEVLFEHEYNDFEEDKYDEEYELSKEDFAKLKSYEVSNDVYKYTSIEHLKEILTLLDKPIIYNLETDWDSEFHVDLSKLKFDYGLICSYGYMDSWDELVNCCMIIDGGSFP